MKVAIVVSTYPPYRGGMGTMAQSYALGLEKLGHQVTVFTPATLKPWLKYGNAAFIPQLLWKLNDFDIVNLHYPFFGVAELVWLLKFIKGKKFKLVINYQMDNVGSGWLGWIFKFNSRFIMPCILKSADKIIVTSLDYLASSRAASIYKKYPEKFVAIPPGVDTEKFQPRPKDLNILNQYKILADEKLVLFVGGLDSAHYFKGLDFLIESWPQLNLPKVKLLIVGQGNLREAYQKKVKELDLGGQIIFGQPVSADELPKYYNLAELLVLPSVDSSEAFGIVQLEALASGVPVLVADLPGVRAVAGEAGLVFKILDASDLISKIKLILTDENLRSNLKQRARDLALSKYAETKVMGDVDELFRQI